jgi:hypothetical protein
MKYQIDQLGRVWLDGGVIVADCGRPWDEYLEWVAAGNTAELIEIEP